MGRGAGSGLAGGARVPGPDPSRDGGLGRTGLRLRPHRDPAPRPRRAPAARPGSEARKTLDQQGTYLQGRGPQGAATARCFPRAGDHASQGARDQNAPPLSGRGCLKAKALAERVS